MKRHFLVNTTEKEYKKKKKLLEINLQSSNQWWSVFCGPALHMIMQKRVCLIYSSRPEVDREAAMAEGKVDG